MHHTFDALIVGAGPAGCAAAYDLAHTGRRVLLLDKRSFPRHKACACGLTRKTLKALRYSVEPILERQCRDVVLQEAGPAFLHGRRSADKTCEVRVRLRQPFCAMAVRERFDHFCLQQTLAAGRNGGHAELRRIDQIVALRELPTHIELTVTLPDGTTETLTAPSLIGADGSNGQTRRLSHAGAPSSARPGDSTGETKVGWQATTAQLPPEPHWYARGFALEATVPYTLLPATLPAGDHPHDLVFDFAPIAGGYGWLFPKADHINIGVGGFVPQKPTPQTASGTPSVPLARVRLPGAPSVPEARVGSDASHDDPATLYESVTRALLNTYTREKLGLDLAAIPGAHVTGQHLGLGGHAYTPQGRILLTGDAAGLVDPLTGEGIHSAIISGQAAAAAILEALPAAPSSRQHEARLEPSPSSKPGKAASLNYSPSSKSGEAASLNYLPSSKSGEAANLQPSPSTQTGVAAGFSPRMPAHANEGALALAQAEAINLAQTYACHLKPLQETLAFSHRAARSFYREPERGFKVMRTPLLRNLVLKTYADGLPTTRLLALLARRVA